ncbi:hypothetical protein GA0115252_17358 [Streptomyces sp. DfronAA-171]|nr:hypothetical protein GA0115252_17358 [Streptomyces sp. DfronAA-171]
MTSLTRSAEVGDRERGGAQVKGVGGGCRTGGRRGAGEKGRGRGEEAVGCGRRGKGRGGTRGATRPWGVAGRGKGRGGTRGATTPRGVAGRGRERRGPCAQGVARVAGRELFACGSCGRGLRLGDVRACAVPVACRQSAGRRRTCPRTDPHPPGGLPCDHPFRPRGTHAPIPPKSVDKSPKTATPLTPKSERRDEFTEVIHRFSALSLFEAKAPGSRTRLVSTPSSPNAEGLRGCRPAHHGCASAEFSPSSAGPCRCGCSRRGHGVRSPLRSWGCGGPRPA